MAVPQPSEPFAWTQAENRAALVCRPLAEITRHLFTTRAWPLGSRTGDGTDQDVESWRDVAAAMGVELLRLVRVRQVHGATALIAREVPADTNDADVIVSDNAGLALAVQAADCVPILIADRRTGAVAAAHAGWRGLSVRVPGTAVATLVRAFGSDRKDLVAAIGPSIGACCYEVGADVIQRFVRTGFTGDQIARWFLDRPVPTAQNPSFAGVPPIPRQEHWFFDAWASARDQLRMSGVPEDQIFVAELCTASHPEWLCSYRRDGAPAGRLAAAIRSGPRP